MGPFGPASFGTDPRVQGDGVRSLDLHIGDMWHRLYYHLVWTTLKRERLIDRQGAGFLCNYFRSVSARYRARILAVGMVSTHVHVFIAGDPQTDWPKLIGHMKGGSATTWNKSNAPSAGWQLRWAPSYGLSTVGRRQVDQVREYLRRQPEHHPDEQIEGWPGDLQSQEFLR